MCAHENKRQTAGRKEKKTISCGVRAAASAFPLAPSPPPAAAELVIYCAGRASAGMEVNIYDWYFDVPIVTRAYLTLSFLLTAACALDFVSFFSLYWNGALVLKGEVGRGGFSAAAVAANSCAGGAAPCVVFPAGCAPLVSHCVCALRPAGCWLASPPPISQFVCHRVPQSHLPPLPGVAAADHLPLLWRLRSVLHPAPVLLVGGPAPSLSHFLSVAHI